MAVLGYFTSTTTSQVILGGIPFKTTSMSIPSYLDGFHCMDSPHDQTIRSERADIPHHRCCHSCESLQPSWEERGCERAEMYKKEKNKM